MELSRHHMPSCKKRWCVLFSWFCDSWVESSWNCMESSSLCINWMFYYRVWNRLWHRMQSCKERRCVLFCWFCDSWVESWWNCIASYFCMLDYALLEPYVTIHRIILESYDLFLGPKKNPTSQWAQWEHFSLSPLAGRIVILCVDLWASIVTG